jgi:hypothetical protein
VVELIGPTKLKVALQEKDIETPGTLAFIVANPAPGGGASLPLTILVVDGNVGAPVDGAKAVAATG